MRTTQALRLQRFEGLLLPAAAAGLGTAAALLEGGPWRWAAWALLLAVCAWGFYAARRERAEVATLVVEHRMLRESVEHNPMPFAVYDNRDRLIAWNEAYEATHAEAFRRLRSRFAGGQLRYADLVQVTAEATMAPEHVQAHVEERVRQQRKADGVAVDREYPGLGWLRVCKFATPSGAVAGFAVDINELKEREAALEAQIALSRDLEQRLRELADTDSLTGTGSRSAFLRRAHDEFARAQRYGHPLCVAMLDIDEFKGVNDRHGHGVGDQVLAQVAGTCLGQLRTVDACGRLGGEEFAILLPETDLAGAQAFAERLCGAIREIAFESVEGLRVSASVGVSEATDKDEDFASLLKRADEALYQAKDAGRNRVSIGLAQVTLSPPRGAPGA
jgi:diguanylate cyclase (GGDEF)-like protein